MYTTHESVIFYCFTASREHVLYEYVQYSTVQYLQQKITTFRDYLCVCVGDIISSIYRAGLYMIKVLYMLKDFCMIKEL